MGASRRLPTPPVAQSSVWRERIPTLSGEVDPVRTRAGRPVLTMLEGPAVGSSHAISGEIVLGRGDEADVRIDEPTVSWLHARIAFSGPDVVLEDLGSTNGTFVRNDRVLGTRVLTDRARIRLGPRVTFRLDYLDAIEQRALRQVYESSVLDPLTGVHNRRYLEERTRTELSYAARNGAALSVLLVDIDHFKRVNDVCGHAIGDAVLRVVATSMRRVIRPEDVLGRYGGEEFVIVARGVSSRNAAILGERIRRRIQRLPIPAGIGIDALSVSVGVATADTEHVFASANDLVAAADAAMYSAKQQGRNRVVVA
jgi:diguanylate cyclase (GGDEF)-like protein